MREFEQVLIAIQNIWGLIKASPVLPDGVEITQLKNKEINETDERNNHENDRTYRLVRTTCDIS